MTTISRCAVWMILAMFVTVFAGGCSKTGAEVATLIDAACDGNVAQCERLVRGGLPVDATDDEGNTALDWAGRDMAGIDSSNQTESWANMANATLRLEGRLWSEVFAIPPQRRNRPLTEPRLSQGAADICDLRRFCFRTGASVRFAGIGRRACR